MDQLFSMGNVSAKDTLTLAQSRRGVEDVHGSPVSASAGVTDNIASAAHSLVFCALTGFPVKYGGIWGEGLHRRTLRTIG
jgi:hypothetical protein